MEAKVDSAIYGISRTLCASQLGDSSGKISGTLCKVIMREHKFPR